VRQARPTAELDALMREVEADLDLAELLEPQTDDEGWRAIRRTRRNEMVADLLAARVLCSRCGATSADMDQTCVAPIEIACAGLVAVGEAFNDMGRWLRDGRALTRQLRHRIGARQ
jgi:hypothetical protein